MNSIEFKQNFVAGEIFTKTQVEQIISVIPKQFKNADGTVNEYAKIQLLGVEKMPTVEINTYETIVTEMNKGNKVYAEYINVLNAEGKSTPKLCTIYFVE